MSIFDRVPCPFPFVCEHRELPIEFTLRPDAMNHWVRIFLLIFWWVLALLILILLTTPFSGWPDIGLLQMAGIVGTLLTSLFFIRRIGQEISELKMHVDVHIDTKRALVTESNGQEWSEPLSNYLGIVRDLRGNMQVEDNKIQIKAIVLRHEDEARSIPLVISQGDYTGDKTIDRIADLLKVEAIKTSYSTALESNVPKGTIVANLYQSMKVRLLYWFLLAVSAALIVTGAYLALNYGTNPVDGGVLRPIGERLAIFGGLAGSGLLIGLGIQYYMSIYVILMRRDGNRIIIRTAGQFAGSGKSFDANDIETLKPYSGRFMLINGQAGHTPFVMMKIRGKKRAFLIDMQAEAVDIGELKKLDSQFKAPK